ncbi:MAG: HesA/MoeB/ThiF family protein [Bacteroidales bacterium]
MGRYDRQTVLAEIGEKGQQALSEAAVLVIGVGGLGSPASLYLAAAGVGRIGLVDGDVISLSNLQRQVLYSEKEVGMPKAVCAAGRLKELSHSLKIDIYNEMLTSENSLDIARGYDIIVDGCDNIATRYLINDVAIKLGIPYIYGAVSEFCGQVSLFNYKNGKSYEDLYPKGSFSSTCSSAIGVIGALPGIIGSIEAMEAIKVITCAGETLRNRLLTVDSLTMEFNMYELD